MTIIVVSPDMTGDLLVAGVGVQNDEKNKDKKMSRYFCSFQRTGRHAGKQPILTELADK
jgi:hypothetical protein